MPDAPQTYAVRLTAQARQDIFHAAERLAELADDPSLARAWAGALYEAVARLATNPRAYTVLARETRLFGQDIQRMLFRRSARAAAYHVLFAVADASADGPIVTILHVRHGSRRPLSRAEALRILANP